MERETEMKLITTNETKIRHNQLFLITYRTNKNGTSKCLYTAFNYGVLSFYADKTLSDEIKDYAYIINVRSITNFFELRELGFTKEQAQTILGSL